MPISYGRTANLSVASFQCHVRVTRTLTNCIVPGVQCVFSSLPSFICTGFVKHWCVARPMLLFVVFWTRLLFGWCVARPSNNLKLS